MYREYFSAGKADMMAPLGVASFGYFRNTHYQNEKDFGPYVDRPGAHAANCRSPAAWP